MKKPPRMKKAYAVLCHLIDCEDEQTFILEGAENCSTAAEARRLMKSDFMDMREEYSPEWSADGKTDPCTTRKERDEILFDVPIWDGENERESWIHCHWKVVEI